MIESFPSCVFTLHALGATTNTELELHRETLLPPRDKQAMTT